MSNFTNLKNRAGLVSALVLSLLGVASTASALTTDAKLSATDSQGGLVTAATLNYGNAARVVSRDAASTLRWSATIDYQDTGSSVAQIAVDGSDNVYVAGTRFPTPTTNRAFLRKYSPSGTLLWDLSPLASGRTAGVALDTAGNAFELVFDTSASTRFYTLLKFTPGGSTSNAAVSTSTLGTSFINDIVVSRPSNVVLMAGTVNGNSTPNYGTTIAFTAGLVQAWTEVDQVRAAASEKGLAADADGNAYVVYSSGVSQIGNQTTQAAEIRKFDHNTGGVVWATGLGTGDMNVGNDASAGLILDASGNVAFAGKGVDAAGAVHFYLPRLSGATGALLSNAYANVTDGYVPTGLCQDAHGDYDVIGSYGLSNGSAVTFVPSFSGNAANQVALGAYFNYYQYQPPAGPFYPAAIVPTANPQSFFFGGLIGTAGIGQGLISGNSAVWFYQG